MKTLKKSCLLIACFAIVGFLNSCDTNTNAENNDSKKEAENHNDAKFDGKAGKDAKFVADAEDINLVEMNLGQLAQSKAMMSDTRDLGTMMYQDHKKAYDDLASLAARKSITIPSAVTASEQKDYNDLSSKNGMDFDKAYCDKMVSGHKDAIAEFEKESKNAGDPDIQVWATNMLPILRTHLDHAMNCQEKCKNKKSSSLE